MNRYANTINNSHLYAENDVPQPHVSLALGLLNVNPLLFKPFMKSISIPNKYKEVPVPGAKVLKTTKVHELVLESDVFINIPILKDIL